jgi:hypothetical protein
MVHHMCRLAMDDAMTEAARFPPEVLAECGSVFRIFVNTDEGDSNFTMYDD